jgi:hypothetical protein
MKKLGIFGLLCFCASLLFAGHTVVPANEKLKINTNDIVWQYDFQKKKCVQPAFADR